MRPDRTVVAGLLVAIAAVATAHGEPSRSVSPVPERWISDPNSALSPATREAVDARLERLERATGHRVAIVLDPDTHGTELATWARIAIEEWTSAGAPFAGGAVIAIAVDGADVAVAAGERVDAVIAERLAKIGRGPISTRLAIGNRDDALAIGVDGITATIEGRPWSDPRDDRSSGTEVLIGGLILLGFIALALYRFRMSPILSAWGHRSPSPPTSELHGRRV